MKTLDVHLSININCFTQLKQSHMGGGVAELVARLPMHLKVGVPTYVSLEHGLTNGEVFDYIFIGVWYFYITKTLN
jgi:hypothetical protein